MKQVAYLNSDAASDIDYTLSKVRTHEDVQIMTLEEFQAGFNHDEISDLGMIEFFDEETAEEKQDKRIEKAGNFLIDDGENTLTEQIELIEQAQRERPDDRIYLSEIEGVEEWTVTENKLTAAEFLDIINS